MLLVVRIILLAASINVPLANAQIDDIAIQTALKDLYLSFHGPSWPASKKQGWVEVDTQTGEENFVASIACDARGLTCTNSKLTSINLSSNNSQGEAVTPPESLGEFITLQRLYLSDNNIVSLPDRLGELTQLHTLMFNNNYSLKKLPASLANLTQLHNLRMGGVRLPELPDYIGRFSELTSLDISHIGLRSLPSNLTQLTKLQRLYLQYNNIYELPADIGNLSQLQYLFLENLPIRQLPASFTKLTHLQRLGLYRTKVTSLPDDFGKLTELEVLDLRGLGSKVLPASFSNLQKVKQLWLSNCKDGPGPLADEVAQLKALEELLLHSCQYTSLPDNIGDLQALKSLNLWSNNITELPESLSHLKTLTKLRLGNNQLSAFPSQVLELNNLEQLDLEANAMQGSVPSQLINLSKLDEDGLALAFNALIIEDASLTTFIEQKSESAIFHDSQALPIHSLTLLDSEKTETETSYTLRWSQPEFNASHGVSGFVLEVKDSAIEDAEFVDYLWIHINDEGLITWKFDTKISAAEITVNSIELEQGFYTAHIHVPTNVNIEKISIQLRSHNTSLRQDSAWGKLQAKGIASPIFSFNDLDGDGVVNNNDAFPQDASRTTAVKADKDNSSSGHSSVLNLWLLGILLCLRKMKSLKKSPITVYLQ